jgi:hypothetical protein
MCPYGILRQEPRGTDLDGVVLRADEVAPHDELESLGDAHGVGHFGRGERTADVGQLLAVACGEVGW